MLIDWLIDRLGWGSPIRTRNPASERPHIHALDPAATRIGTILWWVEVIISALRRKLWDPFSVLRMRNEWLWSIKEMIMIGIEPKYFERNLSIPFFSPIHATWTALKLTRSVILVARWQNKPWRLLLYHYGEQISMGVQFKKPTSEVGVVLLAVAHRCTGKLTRQTVYV